MLVVLLINQKDYALRLCILLFYFFSASVYPPHVSALYKYIRIYLYTFRRPARSIAQTPERFYLGPTIFSFEILALWDALCAIPSG